MFLADPVWGHSFYLVLSKYKQRTSWLHIQHFEVVKVTFLNILSQGQVLNASLFCGFGLQHLLCIYIHCFRQIGPCCAPVCVTHWQPAATTAEETDTFSTWDILAFETPTYTTSFYGDKDIFHLYSCKGSITFLFELFWLCMDKVSQSTDTESFFFLLF